MEIQKLELPEEIFELLVHYDTSSTRNISDRVDSLEDYSEKLSQFAENYVVYWRDELAGFFSFYCNDVVEKRAYLTLIAVEEKYRGMKLGSQIEQFICKECEKKQMKRICLEVDINNSAMCFYEKRGFHTVGDASEYSIYMEKEV